MDLTFDIKKTISEYALDNSEIEICGFLLVDGSLYEADNIADTLSPEELSNMGVSEADLDKDPRSFLFMMDPDAHNFFITQRDSIDALFHSHCLDNSPGYLSPTDIHNSIASKLPYILYHCHPDFDSWDLFDPLDIHPYPLQNKKKYTPKQLEFYLGWPYNHPRCDCLTVFRSYYKGMLDIVIRDYPRPKDPLEYFKGYWDAYRNNLQKEDFVQVEKPYKKNDVVLSTLRGKTPHHVSILLDPSTGKSLHVLEPGRLSETFVYGGRDWIQATDSVWRHKRLL